MTRKVDVRMLQEGTRVEIQRNTYGSPDEYTWCEGVVVGLSYPFADVQIKNGPEVNIAQSRLKKI